MIKNYLLKKIAMMVPVLLGISMIAFILGVLSPGDPAEFALAQNGLDMPTDAQIMAMREEMGLNRPILERYGSWLLQVLQGDLGTSYITGRHIFHELMLRLPVTLCLAFSSLVVAGIVGIGMGVVCAINEGKFIDKAVNSITNAMLAVPGFWLALVLILLFSETLRLLPTSGSNGWQSFVLPTMVLSCATSGMVCRFMRGMLLNEFSSQYFLVARIRGISKLKLLLSYAVPNAIIPVIALLGNYFAGVLGGSAIVESIFALPGLGTMALDAIRFRDYPVLQAYVLVSGFTLVIVTLLVDVLIFYYNPRIKAGGKE